MEALETTIRSLSGCDVQLSMLQDNLQAQSEEVRDLLTQQAGAMEWLVSRLDERQHTLGILYVAREQAKIMADVAFCKLLRRWIGKADPHQLRMAPRPLCSMVRAVAEQVCAPNVPLAAALLAGCVAVTAVEKLEPDTACLTAMHADVVQCFLFAKAYHLACAFVDAHSVTRVKSKHFPASSRRDTYHRVSEAPPPPPDQPSESVFASVGFPSLDRLHSRARSPAEPSRRHHREASTLDPLDLVRYLYYAGLAMCGAKRWSEACDHFKRCITAPASAPSAVQLAAYKKLVLCSLIQDAPLAKSGGVAAKFAPGNHQFKASTVAAYNDIAAAAKTKDPASVTAAIAAHAEALARDGNAGLAKQVDVVSAWRAVARLHNAYIRISVQDLCRIANIDAATVPATIVQLAQSANLSVKFDEAAQTVKFSSGESPTTEHLRNSQLFAHLKDVEALSNAVTRMAEQIAVNPTHLLKSSIPVIAAQRSSEGGGGGPPPSAAPMSSYSDTTARLDFPGFT